MHSYSEQGQDLFAFDNVPTLKGTFLDIGCGDPVHNNNTFALEQLGWRGLVMDCDSRWTGPCKNYRKSPFVQADARQAHWRDLLHEFGFPLEIDYLSLDVDDKSKVEEPFSKTLLVLENMISEGLSFRAITVEHDAYRLGDEPRNSIRRVLLANSYVLYRENISCRPPDPAWAFEDWFVRAA